MWEGKEGSVAPPSRYAPNAHLPLTTHTPFHLLTTEWRRPSRTKMLLLLRMTALRAQHLRLKSASTMLNPTFKTQLGLRFTSNITHQDATAATDYCVDAQHFHQVHSLPYLTNKPPSFNYKPLPSLTKTQHLPHMKPPSLTKMLLLLRMTALMRSTSTKSLGAVLSMEVMSAMVWMPTLCCRALKSFLQSGMGQWSALTTFEPNCASKPLD